MSLIHFKAGVDVSQQAILTAAIVNAATDLGLPDMVITSGRDGTHLTTSKHYSDEALDFRTKHLTGTEKHALVAHIFTRLGRDYDVLLEQAGTPNEHGHVEYDPKEP